VKSKELKHYNLPEDRVILGQIDAKPTAALYILLAIGSCLITVKQIIWGSSIILLSIVGIILLPKRVLIEFYYDFLVLYNHANKNDCEIIYYEDVVKWKYVSGLGYDTLKITLVDNSLHLIDGFSKITFENQMNRFLKDKKEITKKSKNKGVLSQ